MCPVPAQTTIACASVEIFAARLRAQNTGPVDEHEASIDGLQLPMPINLDTVNKLYGLNLTAMQVDQFFASTATPVEPILTSEDVIVSKVGRDLYEKFFKNYTRKQLAQANVLALGAIADRSCIDNLGCGGAGYSVRAVIDAAAEGGRPRRAGRKLGEDPVRARLDAPAR